jgi:hypothetical protein
MEDVSRDIINPQMPIMEQETRTMDAKFTKGPSLEVSRKNKTNVNDETFLEEEERELFTSDGELFVDALATMDTASLDMEEDFETNVVPLSKGFFGLLLHKRNLCKEITSLEEKEVLEVDSNRVERYLMKQWEKAWDSKKQIICGSHPSTFGRWMMTLGMKSKVLVVSQILHHLFSTSLHVRHIPWSPKERRLQKKP